MWSRSISHDGQQWINGHVRWGPVCATEHRSAREGWNADPCYSTYKPHGHLCTERGQVEEEGQVTGSAQEGERTDTDGSLCVGTGFLRGGQCSRAVGC